MTQLRFEGHPSVHKLFLTCGVSGQRNHSRVDAFVSLILTKPPTTLLYKSAHPTLVALCSHESLSNLCCVFKMNIWWEPELLFRNLCKVKFFEHRFSDETFVNVNFLEVLNLKASSSKYINLSSSKI